MHPGDSQRPVTRRAVLSGVAGGTAAGVLLGGTTPTAAAAPTDLTNWFSNTGNADTVTDRTGEDNVTVDVGTDGNGAGFGYGPAVVRVDPGTTVEWLWTGKGGRHNVVASDGSFESPFHETAGATFEHTFETAGVRQYYCRPHEPMGMKGAILVGDVAVTLSSSGGATATPTGDGGGSQEAASVEPNYGDWFRNVPNFESTVDATGQEEVRIGVGPTAEGGSAVFDPAAVHVDPGTTVVWEWTAHAEQRHAVTSDDPEFRSQTTAESGATYALSFEGSGVVRYACEDHRSAGMKGAIVVGKPQVSTSVNLVETAVWGLIGTIIATPFVVGKILSSKHDSEAAGSSRERSR